MEGGTLVPLVWLKARHSNCLDVSGGKKMNAKTNPVVLGKGAK